MLSGKKKKKIPFPIHKNYISSTNKGHCVDVERLTLKL